MELKETLIYTIEIEEQHVATLVNLLIQVERGIKSSGLSNSITIDLECKENKTLVRELVHSFNDSMKLEDGNIASDTHQTKELI